MVSFHTALCRLSYLHANLKDLDTVITRIRHVEARRTIHGNSDRLGELPLQAAFSTDARDVDAVRIEDLNPMVEHVGDIDGPVGVNGDPTRSPKLSRFATLATPLQEETTRWPDPERPITPEGLNATARDGRGGARFGWRILSSSPIALLHPKERHIACDPFGL